MFSKLCFWILQQSGADLQLWTSWLRYMIQISLQLLLFEADFNFEHQRSHTVFTFVCLQVLRLQTPYLHLCKASNSHVHTFPISSRTPNQLHVPLFDIYLCFFWGEAWEDSALESQRGRNFTKEGGIHLFCSSNPMHVRVKRIIRKM